MSSDFYQERNGLEINEYGDKFYYLNDQLHRLDGPAIEHVSGFKQWCQNGKLHRNDGPAVEFSDGTKEWYYQGAKIECNSQEEFERFLKLKTFW